MIESRSVVAAQRRAAFSTSHWGRCGTGRCCPRSDNELSPPVAGVQVAPVLSRDSLVTAYSRRRCLKPELPRASGPARVGVMAGARLHLALPCWGGEGVP